MELYKFNFKKIIKYLFIPVIKIFLWSSVALYVFFSYYELSIEDDTSKYILYVILITQSVFYLPVIFIFINHLLANKNLHFTYWNETNEYSYLSSKSKIKFNVGDIKSVIKYTRKMDKDWIDLHYFDNYFYTKITLKNDTVLIVSCLICNEIEKIIPNDLIYNKRKSIPIIETKDYSS